MDVLERNKSAVDPWSREFNEAPETFYHELRNLTPAFQVTRYACWGVAQHKYATEVINDPETFSSAGGSALANYFKEKPWRTPSLLLETDPPDHTLNRRVTMRAMSPVAVKKLKEQFSREAVALIDGLDLSRPVDGVTDIANVYPLKVFPDSVGLSLTDDERLDLLAYGQMVFAGMGPETEYSRSMMALAPKLVPLVERKCRREALSEGGFGAGIYASVDDGLVSEEDASLIVRSFLSAGLDTTVSSLSLLLNVLARNPAAYQLLRNDRSLVRNAFEEMLRYDGPTPFIFRTTTGDVDFHGELIPKHEKVLIFLGSSNLDPDRFDNAAEFDITRSVGGHLSFGAGIHGCVGQMVARMEAEAVLSALLDKVSAIELAGDPVRSPPGGIRSFSSLPLKFSV